MARRGAAGLGVTRQGGAGRGNARQGFMSPYLIPGTGIWVDLDTIQSITEPRPGRDGLVHWDFAENVLLRWQHAYRYDLSQVVIKLDHPRESNDPDQDISRPLMGPDGRTLFRARVEDEVFKPFFEAWRARKSD